MLSAAFILIERSIKNVTEENDADCWGERHKETATYRSHHGVHRRAWHAEHHDCQYQQPGGHVLGIISHYFGGKQGLIEAALRYLLEQLGRELRERMAHTDGSPEQRLACIVEANFSDFQRSALAAKTWLSFWARSMHEPGLKRLQQINNARLYSNLRYSFAQVLPAQQASEAARQTAAMIDGFWLRSALSLDPVESFEAGERLIKQFIEQTLADAGDTNSTT